MTTELEIKNMIEERINYHKIFKDMLKNFPRTIENEDWVEREIHIHNKEIEFLESILSKVPQIVTKSIPAPENEQDKKNVKHDPFHGKTWSYKTTISETVASYDNPITNFKPY